MFARKKIATIPKPFRPLYFVAVRLVSLFLGLTLHVRVDKSGIAGLKPPYIVLCNHICNLDFLIAASAMYPQRMNFVVAMLYIKMRFVGALIRFMGCIGKQQFVADARAVRGIVQVIRRGDVVILYPSGQSSITGQATHIEPSIAKLLRMLRVPVVALHTSGAHIGFPKWDMSRLRKSRVDVKADILLSPGQLESMSDAQVYERVVTALHFDDYEWQKRARVAARRPRSTKGLERVLYMCPRCGREFGMVSERNTLRCVYCDNAARMDEYGLLHPADDTCRSFDTPTAWYRWQVEEYAARLRGGCSGDARSRGGYSFSEPCALYRVDDRNRLHAAGRVTATLDADALTLCGEHGGARIAMRIDNRLSPIFPCERVSSFEVMADGQLYAVAPDNARAVYKFIAVKDAIVGMAETRAA